MQQQNLNPMLIDTKEAEVVALVSSQRPGAEQWTELAIWFIPSLDGRMFLAETSGHSTRRGHTTRRRRVYVGSMARALEHFDAGDLTDALGIAAADWLERNQARVEKTLEQLRTEERAGRKGGLGYTGSTLLGAVAWLYGDGQAGKAQRLADDFGVPRRTVAHALDQEQAGQPLTGWSRAFVSALQHFDREAFLAAKGGAGC